MARGKKTEAKADDGRGVPRPGGKPWDTTMRKAWGEELTLPKIWHEGEWIQPIIDPDIRAALPDMDGDEDNPTERERAREALYNSLREHGLYQPVILCEVEAHHIVLDGHDRLEAWARLLQEIPDWDPPQKLRAEVIPHRQIIGDQTDPLVCDCLLIGRAVSINCVRRRLTPTSVKKLVINQLLREARANFNRASKWIARDLGCSLQYLQDIRKEIWAQGTIPCPPRLLGLDGVERDNESYSHESKSYKPASRVRLSPKADAFEPEEEKQTQTPPVPTPPTVQEAAEATDGDQDTTEATDGDQAPAETFGNVELAAIGAETDRLQEEQALIEEWNNQRGDKRFPQEYVDWLQDGDFLWVTDDRQVHYLAREEPEAVEDRLISKLSPLFEDLGVEHKALSSAIHRLLAKVVKK